MSGLHRDGIGWNALGVWCGECSATTCEGCKYEYKPFQGFNEKVIAEFKRVQEEDEEFMERELKKPYESMPVENPIPVNAPCGECNTDTSEGCPYKEELDNDGYFDEVGGFHSEAIGWNPRGMCCGECTRETCKGCSNEHETVPAYEKKVEQVFVIECTAWYEPEIHKSYEGAFEGLIENVKAMYAECSDASGNNSDPSAIITDAYEQYNQGCKNICVEDGDNYYCLYSVDLMD